MRTYTGYAVRHKPTGQYLNRRDGLGPLEEAQITNESNYLKGPDGCIAIDQLIAFLPRVYPKQPLEEWEVVEFLWTPIENKTYTLQTVSDMLNESLK